VTRGSFGGFWELLGHSGAVLGAAREPLAVPMQGQTGENKRKISKHKTRKQKTKMQNKQYQTRKRLLRFGLKLRCRELLGQSGAVPGTAREPLAGQMQGQIGENKRTNSKNKNRKPTNENSKHKIPKMQTTTKVCPETAILGALGAVRGCSGNSSRALGRPNARADWREQTTKQQKETYKTEK
jgi:hypothetical protein